MSSPSPLYGIFLIVYLLALVFVGALKARKIKTQADFSLAGRGLPTFVLVGTLLATWIGTGSIFGNAEETYRVGLAGFLLPVAGGLAIIALYFLAARIRGFGQFTVQDILEARFGVGARIETRVAEGTGDVHRYAAPYEAMGVLERVADVGGAQLAEEAAAAI